MSAGLHIGFSFQFQFTVVGDVNRLLRGEYMFVALGIHCKYGCLGCQEGGERSDGICGVRLRAECGWKGWMPANEWRHSGNCLA